MESRYVEIAKKNKINKLMYGIGYAEMNGEYRSSSFVSVSSIIYRSYGTSEGVFVTMS